MQQAKDELNRIVELFKNEELPYKCAKVFIQNGNKPSSKWSLTNKLIMMSHETLDARGYRQWQDVGRYVKKGTKAFGILAPRMIKVDVENKETGEKEKRQVINGWLCIPVFPYENTEGKALPDIQPKQLPPLYEVAERLGIKVQYREGFEGLGYYGAFDHRDDSVILATHDEGTFVHELTHAIHKKLDGQLKVGQDAQQETIAELTACVVCSLYGIDTKNYSYNYIRYYAEIAGEYGTGSEKVYRLITKVLAKVEEILKVLFDEQKQTPTKQVIIVKGVN